MSRESRLTAHRVFVGRGVNVSGVYPASEQGRSVPYARTQVLPHRFDNLIFLNIFLKKYYLFFVLRFYS